MDHQMELALRRFKFALSIVGLSNQKPGPVSDRRLWVCFVHGPKDSAGFVKLSGRQVGETHEVSGLGDSRVLGEKVKEAFKLSDRSFVLPVLHLLSGKAKLFVTID
jgi:hypothetical protein